MYNAALMVSTVFNILAPESVGGVNIDDEIIYPTTKTQFMQKMVCQDMCDFHTAHLSLSSQMYGISIH